MRIVWARNARLLPCAASAESSVGGRLVVGHGAMIGAIDVSRGVRRRRPPAIAQAPHRPEGDADRRRAAAARSLQASACECQRKSVVAASTATKRTNATPRRRPRRRRVVALERVDRERRLRPARRDVGRAPAGRLQPDAQLVAPAARAPAVAAEIGVDLQVGADRVAAPERRARSVDAGQRRILFDVGAEQAIPDEQHAAVVAIEVGVVDGVMDAVVARRAEPAVERAEPADLLGVDPELIEQVDQRDDAEDERRKAGDGHRQVEDPADQPAARRLAQRRREVVVLALVMDDVSGPEQRDAVAGAVMPVVEEVVGDEADRPRPRRRRRKMPEREAVVHRDVDAERQHRREDAGDLAHDAEADARDRVVEAIAGPAAGPADRELDADQRQEDRRRQDDDLRSGHGARSRIRSAQLTQPRASIGQIASTTPPARPPRTTT